MSAQDPKADMKGSDPKKRPEPGTPGARIVAILEHYGEKEHYEKPELSHFVRLWREYVSPQWGRLLFALVLVMLASLEPYAWSWLARFLFDGVLNAGRPIPVDARPEHQQLVVKLAGFYFGLHLLGVLLTWLSGYVITVIGQRVVYALRKRLHESMHTLPLSFFDGAHTGRLLSILLDDVAAIQGSVGGTLVDFCKQIFLLAAGMIIAFSLSPKLACIVLVAMPLYVMSYRHFRPQIQLTGSAARKITAEIYSHVEERLAAVRTIKVFGRERVEVKKFAEHAANLARIVMHSIRFTSWLGLVGVTINVLAVGLCLYLGFREVQEGRMSVGQVMQFYYVAAMLFSPPVAISNILAESQRVGVVLARVFNLMDADPEPPDRPNARHMSRTRGDIKFEDVTFSYPNRSTPLFNGVSFSVPAGATVAVMGPSGCGKSTLLHLLMRFYDPASGRILLDGVDLRDIRLHSVRGNITMVLQEAVVFSGTLAENIRYGCLDAADADVEDAARAAEFHDFVRQLPDGYDTVIGERGTTLSGGERQRLSLARSLLTNPSVLLLDDTTSALDAATEAKVRSTLEDLMRNRTCFVVTHRASTAMASDLVLVLEDGRVTEFGPPKQLLSHDGYFRQVVEQQGVPV